MSEHKHSSEDNETLALLKRIQQQLMFLEKKIDTILAQQEGGSGGAGRSFHKPHFRPRHGGGGFRPREDRGGGGNFGGDRERGPRRPFDRSRSGGEDRPGGGGFGRKKKPFFKRERD